MAAPTLTGKFMVLLGDGATPTEVFKWPCGASARSVTFTNNLGEDVFLDCDDPLTEGSTWVQRWLESQDTELSIEGRLAVESVAMWRGWADGGTVKNVQIVLDLTAAQGGGHWTLPAMLESFELGQEGGVQNTATFTASIKGAGPRVWTAAV